MGTIGDHCAIACAEAFRGDGRIMASPMGAIPRLGARLAKATFEPGLVLTDGVATIVDLDGNPLGAMPFSRVFDTLWAGRRHVMMGATQVDQRGNQNISCIGDWARPKVQLLGSRGAPGNTICHPTSYFVGQHNPKVIVEQVSFRSGLGTDHGAFEIRVLVTNLGVFDFRGPDGVLRLVALHPGITVEQVREASGCPVHIDDGEVATSRGPTPQEAEWLDRLDPDARVRSSLA